MKKTLDVKTVNFSRRKFIVSSAAAGGGLALGFKLPFVGSAEAATAAGTEINVWVAVKPDSTCVIRIARSEMGQGTLTGLAQLVAEELECDWKKVATEHVFPGQNLARKRIWGDMATGGSRGIRGSQDYVRRGGAAARIMLLQAAADQWKVPVGELTVADGVITHAASNKKITYGKVAAAAAKLTPPDPKSIKLKDPKDWKIAGKPMKRLDTADKLNRSKVFAIDLKLPGMLNAAIKDCPVFGGKLKSYDESKIAGMPGVKKVVRVQDTAVAVVADTWWQSKKALEALPFVWDEGTNGSQSSAAIAEMLKEGLNATATNGDRRNGDALKAIGEAATKVDAIYSTPFLAHATMEVMNCTVKLSANKADAWVPSQNLEASLAALSEASGIPLDKCEVHRHDLGGGFGRRGGTQDYVHQAVEIAKQFPDVPVKSSGSAWAAARRTGAEFLGYSLAERTSPRRSGSGAAFLGLREGCGQAGPAFLRSQRIFAAQLSDHVKFQLAKLADSQQPGPNPPVILLRLSGVRTIAAANEDLLRLMNTTPLFWQAPQNFHNRPIRAMFSGVPNQCPLLGQERKTSARAECFSV